MSITGTKFLLSETFPCGYYNDGRMASADYYGYEQPTQFPFERKVLDPIRKNRFSLMRKGLIGSIFAATANDCVSCNACVPLRINTQNFELTTRQKKILDKFYASGAEAIWIDNADITGLIPNLFSLYKKYLSQRFPRSPMMNHDLEDLGISILSKTHTLVLGNDEDGILGFTQIDREGHEASLDYITYDPDHADLFLGSVSFLETVKWAQDNFIPYVYIGSTNDSAALKYKRYYSGLETFDGENWVPYDPKVHKEGPNYDDIVFKFAP